jgi:hypothetical protein
MNLIQVIHAIFIHHNSNRVLGSVNGIILTYQEILVQLWEGVVKLRKCGKIRGICM